MSTIKSSNEHLTFNADGTAKNILFQANGTQKASISSAGLFTSTTIDATVLTGALPAISGANLTGLSSFDPDGAVTINDSGANVDFRVESDTDANALFVQGSTSNVGIGNSSPDVALDIGDGDMGSAGYVGKKLRISQDLATTYSGSDSGTWGGITLGNNDETSNNTATGITFYSRSSSSGIAGVVSTSAAGDRADLRFITRHSDGVKERMIIDTSGNVGIGTTNPRNALDVKDTGSTTNDLINVINIESATTGTAAAGVGTKMTFYGSMTGQNNVELGQIGFHNTNVSGAHGDFVVKTRPNATSAERFRITSGGNVGIGTTSPSEKLHVNGTVKATAFVPSTLTSDQINYDDPSTSQSLSSSGAGSYTVVGSVTFTIPTIAGISNWMVDADSSWTGAHGGNRLWTGLSLDSTSTSRNTSSTVSSGFTESSWYEGDLNVASFAVMQNGSWEGVSSGSHTVRIIAWTSTTGYTCWRRGINVRWKPQV